MSSPSNNNFMIPEFTPGKLADESQLGGLTSLMNNNFTAKPKSACCPSQQQLRENNNNNNEETESLSFQESPITETKSTLLPPKKRIFEQFDEDNKSHTVDVMQETPITNENNMTKQELMDKVVEDIFAKQEIESFDEQNGILDHKGRKSSRLCKGKRYKEFMYEHKMLGNKRDTKPQPQQVQKFGKIEIELNGKLDNQSPQTLDLCNTIKRLAERTNVKIDLEETAAAANDEDGNQMKEKMAQRNRTMSESSDSGPVKSSASLSSSFNLDLRISNLPNLSYETFTQRKKESKKRKIRAKTECESKCKMQKVENIETQLVGSKKRKNKHNITHIGKNYETNSQIGDDLLGLATLAEIAANTEKINEKFSI